MKSKPSERIKWVACNKARELSEVRCYDGALAICQLEEIIKILDEFYDEIKKTKK